VVELSEDNEEQKQKILKQLKVMLRGALEEDAYERMMNVSLVNPELYMKAAQKIIVVFQKFGRKINGGETLALLNNIRREQTGGSISIKRK